jgi:hypothetical protein
MVWQGGLACQDFGRFSTANLFVALDSCSLDRHFRYSELVGTPVEIQKHVNFDAYHLGIHLGLCYRHYKYLLLPMSIDQSLKNWDFVNIRTLTS